MTKRIRPDLVKLVEKIVTDAKLEARQKSEEAQEYAEKRLKNANAQAGALSRSVQKKIDKLSDSLQKEQENRFSVELRRLRLEKKDEQFRLLFERAKEHLAELVGKEAYRKILFGFAYEGIVALGVDKVFLSVSENELAFLDNGFITDLVKRVKERTGETVEIAVDRSSLQHRQGIIVYSADRSVCYNNLIEKRMRRQEKAIRTIIYNQQVRKQENPQDSQQERGE